MRFSSFFLKNFRGIDEVEIKIEKGVPICLLGSNEAGKTTILKGIELLGKRLQKGSLNGGRASIKPRKYPFTDTVVIGAEIIFDSRDIAAFSPSNDSTEDETAAISRYKKLLKEHKVLNIRFEYKFTDIAYDGEDIIIECGEERIERQEQVLKFVSARCPDIIFTDDLLFNVPETIRFLNPTYNIAKDDDDFEDYRNIIEDKLLNHPENRRWQNILSDILTVAHGGESKTFKEEVVNALSREPNNEEHRKSIQQIIAKMQSTLNREIANKWAKTIGQKTFSRFVFKEHINPESAHYDYSIKVESGENVFSLKDRSKGMQWFFCFMLTTKIKASRSRKGVLFLLDEPATNLHIDYQKRIYLALADLAKSRQKNISVVYSTHSPSMTPITNQVKEAMILVHNKFDDRRDKSAAQKIIAKRYEDLKTSEDIKLFCSALGPCIEGNIINDFVASTGRSHVDFSQKLYISAKKIAEKGMRALGIADRMSSLSSLMDRLPPFT